MTRHKRKAKFSEIFRGASRMTSSHSMPAQAESQVFTSKEVRLPADRDCWRYTLYGDGVDA